MVDLRRRGKEGRGLGVECDWRVLREGRTKGGRVLNKGGRGMGGELGVSATFTVDSFLVDGGSGGGMSPSLIL